MSTTNLPSPYLKKVVRKPSTQNFPDRYPFNFRMINSAGFELKFTSPVTIICGENGSGKSTFLEAIAAISGFDMAGGGKGYMPLDHSKSIEASGAELADILRASWLPKIGGGWFFRAESFFSVARYLDEIQSPLADYLSMSHGEGFIKFFEDRLSKQGVYILDEPESALSPNRQLEFMRILSAAIYKRNSQVILTTHSPILMSLPGAQLLEFTKYGIRDVSLKETQSFRIYNSFISDPVEFIKSHLNTRED